VFKLVTFGYEPPVTDLSKANKQYTKIVQLQWQDEVRVSGRLVGGEGWQEKVYNREEWKKLLRKARNCPILHMPME
jgi:hypothetical protein